MPGMKSFVWSISVVSTILLSCIVAVLAEEVTTYEIPQPKFKLLKHKGFEVSIPDEHGIRLFAFHGNLNKKMEKMAIGQFHIDVTEKQNGKWIYQNRKLKVRSGDVIYFWVFVIKNGIGYRLDDGVYEVNESDVKYTSKKAHHKLQKRHVAHFGQYYTGFGFPHDFSQSGRSYEDSDEEKPIGYGFGHGFPHHQGNIRQHFRGPHTPEYHGSFGHDRSNNFGNYHHGNHGHGNNHGHGHHDFTGWPHEHNSESHRGHQRGHNHDFNGWPHRHHDCSDSGEDSDETTKDSFTTDDFKSEESTTLRVTTKSTTTVVKVPTRTTTTTILTPGPEAENPETTTPFEPQIDVRFAKAK